MKAAWEKRTLHFRFTAITSREQMNAKDTYYIKVWREDAPDVMGVGEAAVFHGLSCDARPDFEQKLSEVCEKIDKYSAELHTALSQWPAIRFGLETALRDMQCGGRRELFDTPWSHGREGLLINGLVWMGDCDTMERRIEEKLAAGFSCVKLKIGGIDFESETGLLRIIREVAPHVELRLDANGAFSPREALNRLDALARYDIHSIEQPIRQGQWVEMARLCKESPIPIALDEELIGFNGDEDRHRLLDAVSPAYIILKPTLLGGWEAADRWIASARERGVGWWATSALESDIGLNAIAQWVATHSPVMPQGLGTGQLFTDNIPSPLTLKGERLWTDTERGWGVV